MENSVNKYGILNPEVEKCNHNIRSLKTSISILESPVTFTYPRDVFGICKYCGKPFHYTMDENGKLKAVRKNKKEDNQ